MLTLIYGIVFLEKFEHMNPWHVLIGLVIVNITDVFTVAFILSSLPTLIQN